MSTGLLYHGFGIVGYDYIRTEYLEGDIFFTLSRKQFSPGVLNAKEIGL